MIPLGKFCTANNNNYDGQYIPSEKKVQAVGPLPDRVGFRGIVFESEASSEADARQKIQSAIDSGDLR